MAQGAGVNRTKVVVRKLPPGLTEEVFKAAVDKVAPGAYTWLSYQQGKVSARKTVLSRAFINFSEPRLVLEFKAAFDGHVFVTTKGKTYKSTVEYAPYQKVPSAPARKNPLEGTIEQDPDYLAFLSELQEGPQLLPSAAVQRERQDKDRLLTGALGTSGAGAAKQVVSSPMLEFLKEKSAAQAPGAQARTGPREQQRSGTGRPASSAKGDKTDTKAGAGSQAKGAGAAKAGTSKPDSATKAAQAAMEALSISKGKPDAGAGKDKGLPRGKAQQASAAALAATRPGTAPTATASHTQAKSLLSRPKDGASGPAGTATTTAAAPAKPAPPAKARAPTQPAAALADKGRPAAGSSATGPAARAAAAGAGGSAAVARSAAPSSAAPASQPQPRPTVSARASQPAATATAGGEPAEAAPAAPLRKVRAGFQAYRPPVKARDNDFDE